VTPDPLPSSVRRDTGRNGLTRLGVTSDAATAEIYLHGAHVTAWHPTGHRPVLWMSAESQFAAGRPIRGGVPICFPWFGAHATDQSAPAHGFARIREWRLVDAEASAKGTHLIFRLQDDDQSRRSAWPHAFSAEYRVSVGQQLGLALDVTNTGQVPIAFEAALHSYFAVSRIHDIVISGLEGTAFLDKVAGFAAKSQGAVPIRFESETDRVYLDTESTCTISDPSWGRRITIAKTGSRSTVVWNPWIAKARAMPDFGDDEWPGMVCVETANVRDAAVRLEPGSHHQLTALITVATG
jgi:glucose-6-phosphate 1-epimerase